MTTSIKSIPTNSIPAEIVGPDGSLANKPTVLFEADEAALLRQYKKLLAKHGLREALFCNACWSGNRSDGMIAFVRDNQILFECRCRKFFHQGQTY